MAAEVTPHTSDDELQARRAEIKTELDEMLAERNQRNVPASDDEKQRWNDLNEEVDRIDEVLEERATMRARVEELAGEGRGEKPEFHTSRPRAVKGDDIYDLTTIRSSLGNEHETRRELRDRAMRAIDHTRLPQENIDEAKARAQVERLMISTQEGQPGEVARRILVTGSPVYRRAFGKRLLGQPLTGEEERAGLILSTTGVPVVWSLDPTVIRTSNYVINPLRAIAKVVTIAGTNEWRGTTSGAVVATYEAEQTEAVDRSPTLTQPAVQVQRAQTFVPFSRELEGDWSSIETEMAGLFQEAKDILEATQFYSGAGTTVFPQGIRTGLTNTQRVQTATTAVFVVGDLYSLQNALPPRARNAGSAFIASLAQLNRVRALDTSGGSSLWVQLGSGLPGQLIGMSAYELSTMPTALTTTTDLMVVGDFAGGFLIVDRIGMDVELVPHLFGATSRYPTGERGLWAYWRNSSKVLDPNRFRFLQVL
jgi:HK97 family phage major capsid protein